MRLFLKALVLWLFATSAGAAGVDTLKSYLKETASATANFTQIVFDPESSPEAHKAAEAARSEWCLGIRGKVRDRGMQKNRKGEMVSAHNPKIATGEIEVLVSEAAVFNRSETPPFPIEDTIETREEIRLAHRYLDRDTAVAYLKTNQHQLEENITLRMRPRRWRAVDFSAFARQFS